MSELSERTLVHCSVNQAKLHLEHYFKARGVRAGDAARINLRADVPVPGTRDGVRLARTAIASIVPRHKPGDLVPHYAVTWESESGGPYPTFSGDLAIENSEDYDSFYLVLKGTYEPPLGAVGAAFDAVVGHRIAEASARNLLSTIADSVEADFSAIEKTKAVERSREEALDHRGL
jgi:hypothetical protein